MKVVVFVILACILSVNASAQSEAELQSIRKLVGSFINNLNRGDFSNLSNYCIKEWIHINSNGGITNGSDEVVGEIFQAYKTNLKGAKITVESMTVRMISPDAAIATVKHKIDNQQQVKSFVVVKQAGKWLLALDQSTIVATP